MINKTKICYITYEGHIHSKRMIFWFISNKKYDISLVSLGEEEIKGVKTYRLKLKKPKVFFLKSRILSKIFTVISQLIILRGVIRKERPDILHLHSLYYPSILGVFAGAKHLVITPWNGDVTWTKQNSFLYRKIKGLAFKKARLITADCRLMEDMCLRRFKAKKDCVKILYWSGVDLNKFRPGLSTEGIRRKFHLENTQVVLSVRSISPIYNIDVLVESAYTVIKELPTVKFVLIWNYCNDRILSDLKQRVKELGIGQSIVFLGNVQHEELPFFYNLADVFVSIPSYDSVPTSLLEAMACGVPPVVSELPCVSEWVVNGENGFVVPVGDAKATADSIIGLLKNKELKNSFAQKNLLSVQKADYGKNLEELDKYYRQIKNG